METVIILIMLMVSLSFMLKLTFMRTWIVFAQCSILALTAACSFDIAISQSKTQIQEWLNSPELMLDMAVILTIDVALQIAFCIRMIGKAESKKEKIMKNILMIIPGLLIFPVLFACLVQLTFILTGIDFKMLEYSCETIIIILIPLTAFAMKWLLPTGSQRLELIFYLNCIIAFLGVIATVNGTTAAIGVDTINLPALAAIIILTAAFSITGFIIFKHKKTNKI